MSNAVLETRLLAPTQVTEEEDVCRASTSGERVSSHIAPTESVVNSNDQSWGATSLPRRIDTWAGKQFCPLLRWGGRAIRQSESAVSRLFWFAAALDGYYHAASLLTLIIFSAMSAVMLAAASLQANRKTRSRLPFRLLGLGFLGLFIIRGLLTNAWEGTEFWVFVTFAQYAPVAARERGHFMGQSNSD